MSELTTIDGIKVLLIDETESLNIKTEILKYTEHNIGLIVVGGMTALEKTLNGQSLTSFLLKESKQSIPPSPNPPIEIKALPQFDEPFIPKDRGWKGDTKWYEQGKRKRKRR